MLVSAAFALLAASAAPVAENAIASPSATPVVKEKKICRYEEAITGSITPKRTCKTKAEWDALMGLSPVVTSDRQPKPSSSAGSND
jgi:hypothetical protein